MVAVNNDWKLYRKLLFNFHNRHQDIKTEIQIELEHGNHSVAQRLAHTIKGVAGTVGANRLSEISAQLESALKKENSDRVTNLLDSFSKEVTRVMTALDAFIKKEDVEQTAAAAADGELEIKSPTVLERSRYRKMFQELSDLIDERDSDVLKLVAEIKTRLGPSNINNNFLNLESQINSFKFEQAKEALGEATKDLGL